MAMASRNASLKTLTLILSRKYTSRTQVISGTSVELPSCHGKSLEQSDYKRWDNGGGMFHNSACIDRTALIENGAIVHSNCAIAKDVQIGSGTVIGSSTSIGESTTIGYNVVLSNCSVGQFCVIHHGVCIGQDGFGFFIDDNGLVVKKPQMLNVRIGDHVEIGANTCIDRGSWRDTVIGHFTKLDNLVQIGHNVQIGKCCIICGQSGIAGSATLGDYVTMGGRVAIKDHVLIASKVRLAANSCVTKNITVAGDYAGFPAMPAEEWRRQTVNMRLYFKKGRSLQ
ncbi:hypothetical protein LUZ63_015019 [Rhynchospora breviuscula]|uniref:Uncharacterized protein n=1 Tax=Rhynchospora breviuscula TaxID=2022672 RepID=A0A9Q0CBG1_9POAL|nr:hypothetical protein LUZ63_015019 [Rhynchospora breviuscula]